MSYCIKIITCLHLVASCIIVLDIGIIHFVLFICIFVFWVHVNHVDTCHTGSQVNKIADHQFMCLTALSNISGFKFLVRHSLLRLQLPGINLNEFKTGCWASTQTKPFWYFFVYKSVCMYIICMCVSVHMLWSLFGILYCSMLNLIVGLLGCTCSVLLLSVADQC